MTEFTELDLNSSVSDMDEQEAKQTLSEFMEAHKNNQQAYDTAVAEQEAIEEEYSERVDELEQKLGEFRDDRAEEASEYTNMPPELLAERFSLDELEQIIEEGKEADFSEEKDEPDEDNEPDSLTTFADREEKGQTGGEGASKYRSQAKAKLADHGFPTN
jgi:ADP-ribose pyrophosphatase YjhB (NUDIX family)